MEGQTMTAGGITKIRFGALLLSILVSAACDQKAAFEKSIPKEQEKSSKDYIELLQKRDYEAVELQIDPSVRIGLLRSKLEEMAAYFPAGKPIAVQTIGAETFITPEAEIRNLTFQYQYPDKWVMVNVASSRSKKSGETTVVGFNVYPLKESIERINRFTFDGKGVKHYAVLLAAIVVPIFILGTLVVCIRTPMQRRKWLWVLVVLSGIGQVAFNWTDGALRINPLTVQLFGCGIMKFGLYAPWLMFFTFPIGAIVFLIKRCELSEPPFPASARPEANQ